MRLRKLRLRTLLTSLSVGGVLLTSGLLLGTMLMFQKSNIENSLLDSNIAYARKLADTTDRYFQTAESELAWSASVIKSLTSPAFLRTEADRLRLQSGFFNSVVVVNREAVVTATSPETLKLVGFKLTSEASIKAVSSHKPFISEPYVSAAGNYVVFLSHPLFSSDGNYLGYIGGTIYLKKQSMLSDILSQHFYSENSTVSIVSNDGNIIFSHDSALVGTKMKMSDVLKNHLSSTDYGRFHMESHGDELLTGYASLSKTNWNVFISGTSETVNQILLTTIEKSLWFLLAIVAITALMVAALAGRIASPLGKLADLVRSTENDAQPASIQSVQTWYHEADSLKKAVQEYRQSVSGHIAKLSGEAITDPLTGLYNRRGFDVLSRRHSDEMTTQSVIAIDIDHFKRINDSHGHEAGDAVLVTLAALLRQMCRTCDVVSRSGGEEFILLLPGTALSDASRSAERIRRAVSHTVFPFAGKLTVSAGVASLSDCSNGRDEMLRYADQALYKAKGAGRNAVFLYSPAGFKLYETDEYPK